VALFATRGDDPAKSMHGREQGRGSVALVIVRHGGGPTGLHWKAGLGTVKRLHLALLVPAQHQRVLGRGHVQAHDVLELFDELGVPRSSDERWDTTEFHQFRSTTLGTVGHPATAHCQYSTASRREVMAVAPVDGLRRTRSRAVGELQRRPEVSSRGAL
jgi:hypothetical protein